MGDIIIPTKTYTNVQKLLKFMGINLERMGTKEETLWNQHTEPTSSEK